MDRIDAMRVFARIVERRSFTQAARDLEVSASAATDAIKQLESRLGVRLLQRTTRHVRTTPDGDAFYHRCLSILSDIEEAESAFRETQPQGLLRIDVQGSQSRRFMLPGLSRGVAQYPQLASRRSEGERYGEPVREGIDCVLRVGEPQNNDKDGRRIALQRKATVASAE